MLSEKLLLPDSYQNNATQRSAYLYLSLIKKNILFIISFLITIKFAFQCSLSDNLTCHYFLRGKYV